ncbi:MAG TPA: DUF3108 domain-containing protein [Gammaproteobacteria bacterium]|nr:DUF3108 domain-containing protein [Gammaproteobacteria bacterium]
MSASPRPLVVTLVLALAAAVAGPARAGGDLPAFEEARYDVSWGIVPAGKGMFRARRTDNGYTLRAQICSTGLVDAFHPIRDQLYTEVDPASGDFRPLYHRVTQLEEGKRQEKVTRFLADDRVVYEETKRGKVRKHKILEVPAGIHDTLSIIYAVRRLPLEVGETYRLPLLDGDDVETLVVPVAGRMKLKGHRVLRVRPYTVEDGEREEGGQWELFLTDDDRRIPVRMKLGLSFGRLLLDMTGYRDHGSVEHPARMFCDPSVTMPR